MLILLETPGPGTAPTHFVSRDNPTGTGRNITRFLNNAGMARHDVLLWNTVPWIVHPSGSRNRALRRAEITEGVALLPPLLALLPALRVVILAGRVAREAAFTVSQVLPDATVITMPHPSPTNVCTSPSIAYHIEQALAAAVAVLRLK